MQINSEYMIDWALWANESWQESPAVEMKLVMRKRDYKFWPFD